MWQDENLIKILKNGGVVVMPTDTLYGIVGSALDQTTVERIYAIRKRSPDKRCIVLIGDLSDLEKFAIQLSGEQKNIFKSLSVKPTSIVLECKDKNFTYLHRGTETLAFRIPVVEELCNLLKVVGPLIAPSANPEGLDPAKNTGEAKNYFGNQVDLYVDGGEISSKPSRVVYFKDDGSIETLRP